MKTLLTPEMAVMTRAKELGNYVITVTNSSPKKYRFTFVSRMQNLALDLVEAIFRANGVYIGKGAHVGNVELRRRLQSDARSSAALLSYMAMVAQENQCILTKQTTTDVVRFEMNLGSNLTRLSRDLQNGVYRQLPYFHFTIHEPKVRSIFAPRYRDRVVQRCLSDEILRPAIDPRLIHDNAACRIGRGTHFALNRVSHFLDEAHRAHGSKVYVLKCDVTSYFASIRHDILLGKLRHVFRTSNTFRLLSRIIESYGADLGVGLPLGNQASQWFALYFLDSMDRLVKERLRIRGYSRYMDDMILIDQSKARLAECLEQMTDHAQTLGLSFNSKTQVLPMSQGVRYLGWHLYIAESRAVIRRLDPSKKRAMIRRLPLLSKQYHAGMLSAHELKSRVASYRAHLGHGNAYALENRLLNRAW